MEIGRLACMTSSLAFAAIPLILGDSNDSGFLNYFEASVPESGDNATLKAAASTYPIIRTLAGRHRMRLDQLNQHEWHVASVRCTTKP
jgi:hypothetical protein